MGLPRKYRREPHTEAWVPAEQRSRQDCRGQSRKREFALTTVQRALSLPGEREPRLCRDYILPLPCEARLSAACQEGLRHVLGSALKSHELGKRLQGVRTASLSHRLHS